MDNALRFVVYDMVSCLSQWKLLQVMNFLYDLIHYHKSLPFLGYLFHLFNNGVGSDLLIMSSFFSWVYYPITSVNGGYFSNSNTAQFEIESKQIQEYNPLLGLNNYNSNQLQIINSLVDWIHYHSFYLNFIAVFILVFLKKVFT